MTNLEKMRAAIKAREDARAEIAKLERETGLDPELADMSDDVVRDIRARNLDIIQTLPANGSMSLEKSLYLQMRREMDARAGLL